MLRKIHLFLFLIVGNGLFAQQFSLEELRKQSVKDPEATVQQINVILSEESELLSSQVHELKLVMAFAYKNAYNYDQAFDVLNEIINAENASIDPIIQLKAYKLYGIIYGEIGDYEKAFSYYYKSLEIIEQSGLDDKQQLVEIYNNLGTAYLNIEEVGKARETFQQSLNLLIEQRDTARISIAYNNMGSLERKDGNYELANAYFRKSLYYGKDHMLVRIRAHRNLGYSYELMGLSDSAQFYYSLSYDFAERDSSLYDMSVIKNDMANLRYQQGRFAQALAIGMESLQLATGIDAKELVMSNHELCYKALKQLARFEEALKHYEQFNTIKVELLGLTKAKEFREIEARYALNKKQQRINHLEEVNRLNESKMVGFYWIGGLSVVLAIVVFWLMVLYIKKLRIKKRLAAQENLVLSKEIQVLGEANEIVVNENAGLIEQIDHKQRELASIALHQTHNRVYLDELKTKLKKITIDSVQTRSEIQEVAQTLQKLRVFEKDWETFKIHFETVHPTFFTKVQEICHGQLTPNELRHCAYVKLKLTLKETASFLNVGEKAVKMARYRLKKKLKIDATTSLSNYIAEID